MEWAVVILLLFIVPGIPRASALLFETLGCALLLVVAGALLLIGLAYCSGANIHPGTENQESKLPTGERPDYPPTPSQNP